MSRGLKPRRIEPDFRRKVWGARRLEPWFRVPDAPASAGGGDPVGEVWFPADDLLIKFIFTSQKLSVQVHPDDDYALERENSRGKTEMWYILRADPGAKIAIGFKQPITKDELIPAALSGEIMGMLNWIEVQPDETYFVPAGTVHAIGEGLALCEIQQNSDVTYRLFDYGRPRELHLEPALEVSEPGCHPGKNLPRELAEGIHLVAECRWFRTYRVEVNKPGILAPQLDGRFLVLLEGRGRLNGVEGIPGSVFELKAALPGESASGSNKYFVEPEPSAGSGTMKLLLIA